MESRWLRTFLLLAVIPVFLGTTLRVSSADEPDKVAEVRAYVTSQQAALIPVGRLDVVTDTAKAPALSRAKNRYLKSHTMSDISAIVTGVADQLVYIQRTEGNGYTGADITDGWPRYLTGGSPQHEHIVPYNYGIAGLGLLAAYQMNVKAQSCDGKLEITSKDNRNTRYLNAARLAGNKLASMVSSAPATDPNLVSTDVIFLYGLSRLAPSDDPNYYNAGLRGLKDFVQNQQYDEATEVYNIYNQVDDLSNDVFHADYIKQLKVWQLATWVEAAKLYSSDSRTDESDALLLGTWADNLMNNIICSKNYCWDPNTGAFYYDKKVESGVTTYSVRTAGQAKVVEVLRRFYADDAHKDALLNGLACLKGLQYKPSVFNSGCGQFHWGGQAKNGILTPWHFPSLQDQFYGIRGMAYNFQTTWKKRDNYKGTYWGVDYLIKSMMMTKYPAIELDVFTTYATPRVDLNSEGILALYISCKEGDVTASGNITAYNALKAVKACVGEDPANPNDLKGSWIVSADRNDDGYIDQDDIAILLDDAVGKHRSIGTFIDVVVD